MSAKPPLHPKLPTSYTEKGFLDKFSFNKDMTYDAFWLANKKLINSFDSSLITKDVFTALQQTRKNGGRRTRRRKYRKHETYKSSY